jgi:hypothetical protein
MRSSHNAGGSMRGLTAGMAALVALGILFFLYASPATPSAEMTADQIAEIEAAVIAAAEGQNRAWRSEQDMDEYMSYHSGWAGSPWPSFGSLDELRTRMTSNWARWDVEGVGQKEWEVRVLAPDVAAVKGTWQITQTDTAGLVRVFDTQDAHVWVLEESGWIMLVATETWTRIEQ